MLRLLCYCYMNTCYSTTDFKTPFYDARTCLLLPLFFSKKKKNLFVQETDRFSFDCFSLVKFQQLKKKSLWARQLPIMVSASISMVQMRQAAVMSLQCFHAQGRNRDNHAFSVKKNMIIMFSSLSVKALLKIHVRDKS